VRRASYAHMATHY